MKRSTSTHTGIGSGFRCRKTVFFALGFIAAVLVFTVPVTAQDEGFPWAKKVDIDSPSMLEILNNAQKGGPLPNWAQTRYDSKDVKTLSLITKYASFLQLFKRHPFFTPDGSHIVFDDFGSCSWIVPVTGGEPDILGEWKTTYELKRAADGTYYVNGGVMSVEQTFGITDDGKGILGVLRVVDPQKGEVIQISPARETISVIFNASQVVLKDIATGKDNLLADNSLYGRLSHDGRWFVYVKRDPFQNVLPNDMNDVFEYEAIITGMYMKDLTTGNEWQLAKLACCPSFSADDSAIICSMKDAKGLWQIFKIPREGGNPTQITFYGPNDTGRNARVSNVSPDGQWVLHTGDYTVGSDTKTGLCVCNMVSGVSYPLFPDAQNTTTEGSWSPDGKKIVFTASCPNFEDGMRILDKYEIFILDFNPNTFGKPSDIAEAFPSGFAITGNRPNPFNPSTAISFSLPKAGTASLTVYDITGRVVRELAAGSMTAGAHSVVWDGRDSSGRAVSSGVYLARLSMSGAAVTHRMMLMK